VRTGNIDHQGKLWLPDLLGDLMKEGTQQHRRRACQ